MPFTKTENFSRAGVNFCAFRRLGILSLTQVALVTDEVDSAIRMGLHFSNETWTIRIFHWLKGLRKIRRIFEQSFSETGDLCLKWPPKVQLLLWTDVIHPRVEAYTFLQQVCAIRHTMLWGVRWGTEVWVLPTCVAYFRHWRQFTTYLTICFFTLQFSSKIKVGSKKKLKSRDELMHLTQQVCAIRHPVLWGIRRGTNVWVVPVCVAYFRLLRHFTLHVFFQNKDGK